MKLGAGSMGKYNLAKKIKNQRLALGLEEYAYSKEKGMYIRLPERICILTDIEEKKHYGRNNFRY